RTASPLSPVHAADRWERTACDRPAIARGCPHYPFPQPAVLRLSPTRETLAQRHARWPRRISLRDGAQRVRACMANSAASSRVRTVTSRTRRRGGSNTKSVMPRKLLSVDRNQQERAPLRSGHTPISLLYHYYSTNITSISSL